MSLIKVKEELVTETNEDNDLTTMTAIGIILCFIEHFYYPLGPLKYLVIVSFLWNDTWNWAQMLIILLNEQLWTSVVFQMGLICRTLQTWLICILIILITQLVQRKLIISKLFANQERWLVDGTKFQIS